MPGSKKIYPFSDTSLSLRIKKKKKKKKIIFFSHFLDVDTLFEVWARGGGGGGGVVERDGTQGKYVRPDLWNITLNMTLSRS